MAGNGDSTDTLREELSQRVSTLNGYRGVGVSGAGAGMRFLVYVDSSDCEAARSAPRSLDGVPVEIVVAGRIRPS